MWSLKMQDTVNLYEEQLFEKLWKNQMNMGKN